MDISTISTTFVIYEQDDTHYNWILDGSGDDHCSHPSKSGLFLCLGNAYGQSVPAGYIHREISSSEDSQGRRQKKIANAVFLFIAVAIIEFLIIVSVHLWISDSDLPYPSIAGVLVNPIFVATIITLLCLGDHFLSKWLKEKYPIEDSQITFISDRHMVSLMPDEIIYIESNDREVTVFATEDRTYRNKTGISQWENILGDSFIRIHRSYIVNRASVTSYDKEYVHIADLRLPISRKYYKSVLLESQSR